MIAKLTLADILRPAEKTAAVSYDIALILAGSLLIALSAQVAVGWPVPFTGQTFAVLFIAALLGGKRAVICVTFYLAEGLCGLPVFSAARGGMAMLLGPTGGYLMGFIPAAFVTGWLAQRGWDRKFVTTVAAMIIGSIIFYSFGLTWLALIIKAQNVLAVGLLPFIPGDILKILLAAALLPAAWKLVEKLKQ
jgi:biotin transporter BioY